MSEELAFPARVEFLRMIIQRLERLSADSRWSHIASGYRGSMLKMLDTLERQEQVQPDGRVHVEFLIDKGLELLTRAARDMGDPSLIANLWNVVIQPMTSQDWPVVRAIYEAGLATGKATFETEAPEWQVWDQNHLPVCRLVARLLAGPEDGSNGQVIGWAALSPVSKRKAYAGIAEVSIYISPAARGHGVGRSLLETLISCSEEAGFWTLQVSIFAVNEASRQLHLACGFREVGFRERISQRDGVWCDTVIMERRSTRVGV
jgi:L-amino acid N-acyltransferase YncA